MKNLFESMKPEVMALFTEAEIKSPYLITAIKSDLLNNYFISDIKLNTAFIFCFFILDCQLDYSLILDSFNKQPLNK